MFSTDINIQELEATADLVNRICRIMADLPVEPGRAKYWVEVRSPLIHFKD